MQLPFFTKLRNDQVSNLLHDVLQLNCLVKCSVPTEERKYMVPSPVNRIYSAIEVPLTLNVILGAFHKKKMLVQKRLCMWWGKRPDWTAVEVGVSAILLAGIRQGAAVGCRGIVTKKSLERYLEDLELRKDLECCAPSTRSIIIL